MGQHPGILVHDVVPPDHGIHILIHHRECGFAAGIAVIRAEEALE